MSKDKEYIIDKNVDTCLSDEDRKKLRQQKMPVKGYKRQDVFTDRRDPYSKENYNGAERRKTPDRRDKKD